MVYRADYVEIYDALMRGRGKDYRGQAREVARLVRQRRPDAASLLDLGCGTGLHLEHFAGLFDEVAGADRSAEMLALAGTRVPGLRTWRADLGRLRLGRRFDAITCLFAIPHLNSPGELAAAVAGLVRHLTPGGVLVVEPWYAPTEFAPGYVASDLLRTDRGAVARLSHSSWHGTAGDRVEMVVHCAAAEPGTGLRHFTETVRLSLFTPEQYRQAFLGAGCGAEHVAPAGFAWGLWVAQRGPGD